MADVSTASITVDADAGAPEIPPQVALARDLASELGDAYFDHRNLTPFQTLVDLVRGGDQYEKEELLNWVCSMASVDSTAQNDLVAAGMIVALVEIVKNGEADAPIKFAMKALRAIANSNAAATEAVREAGGVEACVQVLYVGTEVLQNFAMEALYTFVRQAQPLTDQLADAGVIPLLVGRLETGSASSIERAYQLLSALAYGSPLRGSEIVAAGALGSIVENLKNGKEGPKEMAACVVGKLSSDADKDAAMAAGVLEPLVMMLREGSSDEKYWAASALSQLSCNTGGDTRAVVVDVFAVRSIIQFLRDGKNKAFMACVLSNLAYTCPANQDTIVEAGAVGPLLHLLRTGEGEEKRMAAAAFGNLACKHPGNQDLLLSAGVIPPLVELLRVGSDEDKRTAADVLGDLVRKNRAAQTAVNQAGATPLLAQIAKDGTGPLQLKAIWALGKLAKGNHYNQTSISESGAIEALTDQLWNVSGEHYLTAMRTLGKLAAGHVGNQTRVVKARVVGMMVAHWRIGGETEKRVIAKTLRHVMENKMAYTMVESLGALEAITDPQATQATLSG